MTDLQLQRRWVEGFVCMYCTFSVEVNVERTGPREKEFFFCG